MGDFTLVLIIVVLTLGLVSLFDQNRRILASLRRDKRSETFPAVYFVRPDGSDQNIGTIDTAAHAFLTIQRAIDEALTRGCPSSTITIRVAHGTYSNGISIAGPIPAKGDADGFRLHLFGDKARPERVLLEVTGSDAVSVSDGASILMTGFTVSTRKSGNLISATRRATIGHRNCVFGPAASETIGASRFAEVLAIGPTTVSGSSAAFSHATSRSIISFSSQALVFADGLRFSRYLWGINDATIRLDKGRILGSPTGGVSVHVNGVLNVSGLVGDWSGGAEPRALEGGLIVRGKGGALCKAPGYSLSGELLQV